MQSLSFVTLLLQFVGQSLGHVLRIGKYHHPAKLIAVQQIAQALLLALARNNDGILGDMRQVRFCGLHINLDGVSLKLPGDGLHILVGGGREHHQLPCPWHRFDNLGHIFNKAHLEHFISFIDDHCMHFMKLYRSPVHQVQHPTGGGYNNLRFALEQGELLGDRLSAI